jgi:tetratricopeptide (TPR) repeat protein
LTTSFPLHRTLRKIPALRALPRQDLERIRDRLVRRSYRAGEVIWRTRRAAGFLGFVRSGEIEVEYRINGVRVRSKRLGAGDPLPPGNGTHTMLVARALTDVSLYVVPDVHNGKPRLTPPARRLPVELLRGVWLKQIWPLMIVLLVVGLAREDMLRIASGVLYLAAFPEQHSSAHDPRSMSLLKTAVQVDPAAAFAYNEEGFRRFEQEQLAEAETAFLQAANADRAYAPALNNMAITYFSRGDRPRAAQVLQLSVERDPDNALTRYNLGIVLMQENESAQAVRHFQEAGFIDPQSGSPHLQQAFLYLQMGDDRNAEGHARRAIQLDPSQSPARLLLSIALYRQERYPEALISIAESLQMDPGDRVARFYQALILERLGQYETALPILEELLNTASDPREAGRISVEIEAVRRFLSEREAAAP